MQHSTKHSYFISFKVAYFPNLCMVHFLSTHTYEMINLVSKSTAADEAHCYF